MPELNLALCGAYNLTEDASGRFQLTCSFSLRNAAGGVDFNNGAVNPTKAYTSSIRTATPTELSEADFTQAGFSGIYDLGNVFPTGMDVNGLAAFLTDARYSGQSGTGAFDFDLIAVPEPSTAAFLGLAAAGLLIRRRRASGNA